VTSRNMITDPLGKRALRNLLAFGNGGENRSRRAARDRTRFDNMSQSPAVMPAPGLRGEDNFAPRACPTDQVMKTKHRLIMPSEDPSITVEFCTEFDRFVIADVKVQNRLQPTFSDSDFRGSGD
jgi:hypothetical protein